MERQKHWHLYKTNLCTRRRHIASCPWPKQSHFGNFSNRILRISTFVNDEILRSTANFASSLSNVTILKYLVSLAKCLSVRLRTKWFWVRVQLQSFLVMLLFSSCILTQKSFATFWKHPWIGILFFEDLRKFLFSPATMQKHSWVTTFL